MSANLEPDHTFVHNATSAEQAGAPATRTARAARLDRARLYLCTPIRPDLAALADAVLGAGVDIIQLRDKHAEAGPLLEAAVLLRTAADRHGALLAVNDRADVALAAGADILHLGQDDLPAAWARRVVGPEMLLGHSTHSLTQAGQAAAEAWDYLAVGPTFATPTKPGRPPVGTGLLREVTALDPPMPWFVTGGVDAASLNAVLATGARRVVVVRAILTAADPAAVTADLTGRLADVRAHP